MANKMERELARLLCDILGSRTHEPKDVGIVMFWLGELSRPDFLQRNRTFYKKQRSYLHHLGEYGHMRNGCIICYAHDDDAKKRYEALVAKIKD